MSICKRVRDLTLSTIHEIFDDLEDPKALIKQHIRDVEREIIKANKALYEETELKNKWENEINALHERIEKRMRQAELAIEHGNDEIAKKAIEDKIYCEQRIEELNQFIEQTSKNDGTLSAYIDELKAKYHELLYKKESLMSREKTAKVMNNMNQLISDIQLEKIQRGFQKIENKILEFERDNHVMDKMKEIINTFGIQDKHNSINEELEAMKQKKNEKKDDDTDIANGQ